MRGLVQVLLLAVPLQAAASPADAIEKQLRIIETDPSLAAKTAAGQALAAFGPAAMAPILDRIRQNPSDYLGDALRAVSDAIGPAAKLQVAHAVLASSGRAQGALQRGCHEEATYFQAAVETLQAGKTISGEGWQVLEQLAQQLTEMGRNETRIRPVLAVLDASASVVKKSPELSRLHGSLQTTGKSAPGRTFTLRAGKKPTAISLRELEDFFIQLPEPKRTTRWDWGVGGEPVGPGPTAVKGLKFLGLSVAPGGSLMRFIALEPITTPLEFFQVGGVRIKAPTPHFRAVLTATALAPRARAKRLAALRDSQDNALRTAAIQAEHEQ
jgi:hypothetical protein